MDKYLLTYELRCSKAFFLETLKVMGEGESGITPYPGMMSLAQQVAHVAQTVEWFLDGMKGDEGFDMDFEAHMRPVLVVTSLAEAKAWLERAFEAAESWVNNASEADLQKPFPTGPVMAGQPRVAGVFGIIEHTAHHRGALTVYVRSVGKQAPIPYFANVPWLP